MLVAATPGPNVIQALGKGIVKIVVIIGGDPPIATKLNVTTDCANAPIFTSSSSVMRRSHVSVLEMVATYSITFAKTPSWKSKPVPNSSTVVPACSFILRAALKTALPDFMVMGRGSMEPSRLEGVVRYTRVKESRESTYNPSSLISPVKGSTVI